MKRVFYLVFAVVIVSIAIGCGAPRKTALNTADYGRHPVGSMAPIVLGEKYPSLPLQTIPPRPDLVKGTLPNDLTYYILRGDNEEETTFEPGKACFRLVQNTGALVEEPNKTGVAHFVEHFAFNGTEHFPRQSAIEFMRRVGIRYGDDANAVTTYDYTEYMLDNVPVSKKKSNIDSCLLLLRDWACALTFDASQMERERSVVLEEYRRLMLTEGLDVYKAYFEGTCYGRADVIGRIDDIKSVSINDLRDYYNKWYQPQNQAVVVFGDVDVRQIEAKIKATFGGIPRGKSQVPSFPFAPAAHSKPKAHVLTDENDVNACFVISFSLAGDSLVHHRNTTAWYINSQVREGMMKMLRDRLERIQNETMLINGVEVDDGTEFFKVKSDCPMSISFIVTMDSWRQGLGLVAAEIEKIKRYGWTKLETELYFAKGLDGVPNVDLTDVVDFTNGEQLLLNEGMLDPQSLSNNFVYGTPIFDGNNFGVMDFHTWHGTSPSMAHDYFCRMASDSNTVIMFSLPKNVQHPSDKEVLDAYLDVRNSNLESTKYQYAEDPNFYKMIDPLPDDFAPGKVVATQKSMLKQCTELTLSNGVKVVVTNVGCKENYVTVKVFRFDELCYYNDDDALKIQLLPDLTDNKFSPKTYNQVNMLSSMTIEPDDCDEFSFDSGGLMSAKSVFKYVRYALTDCSIDSLRFANYKKFLLVDADKEKNPLDEMDYHWNKAVFGDGYDNRYGDMPKQQISNMTCHEMQELYKSYTSNYNGAVAVVRTEYPVETILPLIEKYLGSLPSSPRNANLRKVGPLQVAHGVDSLHVKCPVQTPRTDIIYGYAMDSDAPYKEEHDIVNDAFTSILNQLLYDEICTGDGIVYDILAQVELPTEDVHAECLRIEYTCDPKYAATVTSKIDQIIRNVAYGDIVTPQMLREYVTGAIINIPRLNDADEYFDIINDYYRDRCTYRQITSEKLLRALTVDDVKAYARQLLEKGRKKQVVISTE